MRLPDDTSKDLETLEIQFAKALADQSIPLDQRVDLQHRIDAIRTRAQRSGGS
jgi:hypothetical protein